MESRMPHWRIVTVTIIFQQLHTIGWDVARIVDHALVCICNFPLLGLEWQLLKLFCSWVGTLLILIVGVLEPILRNDCLTGGSLRLKSRRERETQEFLYRFGPSPERITTLLLCGCIEYADLQIKRKTRVWCLVFLIVLFPPISRWSRLLYSPRSGLPYLQFKGRLKASDDGAVTGDYCGNSNVLTLLGSYHQDKELNRVIISESNNVIDWPYI